MKLINMWYSFFILLTSGLSFLGSDSVDGLKKTADRDFLWLLIATGLVAIGLLFEVGEVCQELKKWWKARGRKRSWVPVISAVGFLLVTIGVVGEGIFEGKLGIADTSIREKDEKTAQDAGDAAGKAQQSAQGAAADAVLAKSSADSANKEAGKAQQKAGDVAQQAEELNRKLVAATTRLEAVDAKRAELEKSLVNLAVCNAPRIIPFWSIGAGSTPKTAADPLKPFAGRQVVIEFLPFDTETRRAASHIVGTLKNAGWNIAKVSPVDGIEDGVEIQWYFKSSKGEKSAEEVGREWQIHIRSSEAVDALVDFLHSYNWQAREGWPPLDTNDIPPDGLKVRVGLYPAVTYVSPPGAKDFAVAIAQFQQEREKNRKKIEQEQLKREEEFLKNLTPQQAIELKARTEEFKQREKLWMERYSGPCQPLNPLVPSLR